MLESCLVEGPSELRPGRPAVYGQSITDGCISLDQTEKVLEQLVRAHQVQKTALDSHIP
jgi:3-deoxy-7-phosphoheptulonate synthase